MKLAPRLLDGVLRLAQTVAERIAAPTFSSLVATAHTTTDQASVNTLIAHTRLMHQPATLTLPSYQGHSDDTPTYERLDASASPMDYGNWVKEWLKRTVALAKRCSRGHAYRLALLTRAEIAVAITELAEHLKGVVHLCRAISFQGDVRTPAEAKALRVANQGMNSDVLLALKSSFKDLRKDLYDPVNQSLLGRTKDDTILGLLGPTTSALLPGSYTNGPRDFTDAGIRVWAQSEFQRQLRLLPEEKGPKLQRYSRDNLKNVVQGTGKIVAYLKDQRRIETTHADIMLAQLSAVTKISTTSTYKRISPYLGNFIHIFYPTIYSALRITTASYALNTSSPVWNLIKTPLIL